MNEYSYSPAEIVIIDNNKLDNEEPEREKATASNAVMTTIELDVVRVVPLPGAVQNADGYSSEQLEWKPVSAERNNEVPQTSEKPVVATVLLPAYNEELALPEVLKSLLSVLDDTYEIIVVDDGSTDNTAAIARSFPCRLISQSKNQGKGAAVRKGLSEARGEYVIVMDADNTYPAESVPELVEMLQERDFVRGIRRIAASNTPRINRIGNKMIDSALKLVYGLDGADHLSGLYALRRDVFNSMHFVADGFDLEVEIGIKSHVLQLRSGILPIDYRERLGEKKLHPLRDGWKIVQRMLSLALLYNPSRMFLFPGILLWGISAIFTVALGLQPSTSSLAGINSQAFVIAALGVPAGFQLIVFGIAAALYGVERQIPPKNWLVTVSRARVRFWAGIFGAALLVLSLAILAAGCLRWIFSGNEADFDTRTLVLALVFLLWGFQMVLAVLFISIFAGRIETSKPARVRSTRKRFGLSRTLKNSPEAE